MPPETPETQTSDIVLAFDIGRKKTGVAIGNSVTRGARALTVIRGGRSAQLQQIEALITEWKPDAIVAGLPVHIDGTEHAMTRYCRYFIGMLEARVDCPVHAVDERLSTQVNARAGADDADAAAVILQAWWDEAARKSAT